MRRGGREFFVVRYLGTARISHQSPVTLHYHRAGRAAQLACWLLLLLRERYCGLAFSNGGYLKRTGSLKTALYVDQAIFCKCRVYCYL